MRTSIRRYCLLLLFSPFQLIVHTYTAANPLVVYWKRVRYTRDAHTNTYTQPQKKEEFTILDIGWSRHVHASNMGSISSMKWAEILSILKYQQCTNKKNTEYLKVMTVRQPSKFLVPQLFNSASIIDTQSTSIIDSTSYPCTVKLL